MVRAVNPGMFVVPPVPLFPPVKPVPMFPPIPPPLGFFALNVHPTLAVPPTIANNSNHPMVLDDRTVFILVFMFITHNPISLLRNLPLTLEEHSRPMRVAHRPSVVFPGGRAPDRTPHAGGGEPGRPTASGGCAGTRSAAEAGTTHMADGGGEECEKWRCTARSRRCSFRTKASKVVGILARDERPSALRRRRGRWELRRCGSRRRGLSSAP